MATGYRRKTAKTRNAVSLNGVVLPKAPLAPIEKENAMLKWAIILAIVALVAGALGFTGIAGAAAGVAKILFFIFLIGFVLMLVLGTTVFKAVSK
jgi:uncharacterized membrane protein YtjA (UPF0391 family)